MWRYSALLYSALAMRYQHVGPFQCEGDGHLVVLLNGYYTQGPQGSIQLMLEGLCHSGATVLALSSNLGQGSVEPLELQGRRAAAEIREALAAGNFSHYSLIGHSLGGLVARVAAAELADLTVKPLNFISLFSPHSGVEGFVAKKFLPFLLKAGGIDRGALKDILEENVEKSVLVKLAQGRYREALRSFSRRVLYASPQDWLVDFSSGLLANNASEAEEEPVEEYPLLHIREATVSQSKCTEISVRCSVVESLKDVAFERVTMAWSMLHPEKHSWKDMSLGEQHELHRHMALHLGSNFVLHRGAKCDSSQNYCAEGLICKGVCQILPLQASDCNSPECPVAELNHIFQRMSLVITSSGGGGHLVAAKNLQQELLEEEQVAVQVGQQLLSQLGHLLTAEARRLAKLKLQEISAYPSVQLIDLMRSPCTSLGGLGSLQLGGFMSEQWNRQQRAGDIQGLKKLIRMQPWTQSIFGSACRSYMRKVFAGENQLQLPARSIFTVQPLLLESLLAAAQEETTEVYVELFMTDLPTPEAVHFFQPLKSMEEKLKGRWRRQLKFHSLPAAKGGAEALEQISGVPEAMTRMEKFMPVNPAFKRPHGLPAPGQMVLLKLKAQLPLEESFLKDLGNPLAIEAEDEVLLVMLGSQPTSSAVKAYAQESLKLPRPARKRYVLLACGKPTVDAYAQLYAEVVELARQARQASTVLVPFTGQDAKEMLGRADVSLTRSGGLTAGELLALRARPQDAKRVLLHAESVPSSVATKALARGLARDQTVQQAMMDGLLEGMVPWEAGNARYLVTAAQATVVTPQTFVEAMARKVVQPFEVDWQVLLSERGYGRDEVAFAATTHECAADAVCERGLVDEPVHEQTAQGRCRELLWRFSDPWASSGGWVFGASPRFSNSHWCHGKAFLVRKRPSLGAAKFDAAAKEVTAVCGATRIDCDGFVILQLA